MDAHVGVRGALGQCRPSCTRTARAWIPHAARCCFASESFQFRRPLVGSIFIRLCPFAPRPSKVSLRLAGICQGNDYSRSALESSREYTNAANSEARLPRRESRPSLGRFMVRRGLLRRYNHLGNPPPCRLFGSGLARACSSLGAAFASKVIRF